MAKLIIQHQVNKDYYQVIKNPSVIHSGMSHTLLTLCLSTFFIEHERTPGEVAVMWIYGRDWPGVNKSRSLKLPASIP